MSIYLGDTEIGILAENDVLFDAVGIFNGFLSHYSGLKMFSC